MTTKGSAHYIITDKAKPYLDSFQDHSRRLRNWLVAYGIGALVLFASPNVFSQMLKRTNISKTIILVFLVGVSIQIIAVFVYKMCMWYVFLGLADKDFQRKKRYRVSDWISEQLWLESIFDLGTIVAFVWATWRVLSEYSAITS